ncbi:MAG TPA: hypothetical protein VFY71_16685 [Planctomycetota bacterium]|nr:hypothetical protein [Planctomycetota bacterium]
MLRYVLFTALLAAPAAAQAIASINGVAVPFADPADIIESSIGTRLTIEGSGFGGLTGLSKPKVFINSVLVPKKRPLKVISFTDTEVVADIKSGVVGDFDLTIQPKGKDLAPLVAEAVVRIVLPVFEQPTPGVTAPSGLVTLSAFEGPGTFGTKIGKVKVGGKKAKVESWTADEIVFLMPTKLADGLYVVEVKNKIGTSTVEPAVETQPYCLQMDGSAFDVGGPDRFSCKVGKKAYKASGQLFGILASVSEGPPATVSVQAMVSSTVPYSTMLVVMPLDLATATFPVIIHGSSDGKVEFSQTDDFLGFDPTVWSTSFEGEGANDWIVVLNSYDFNDETGANQLAGAFSGHLQLTSDSGSPASYDVTLGDFRVTVEP